MRATKLFISFFESEKASGIILLICTAFSILITNTTIGENYLHFWHTPIGTLTIEQIINDGLMTIFFLMIGLELEREVYIGELSNLKNALLPISAAIGGMVLPAFIYYLFTHTTHYKNGIGIPMATDIAFAIGILSLLGKRVPMSLKIFLTALAVIDDLGAIMVIALFYSQDLQLIYLLLAVLVFVVLLILNRLKVYVLWPYLLLGVAMWYFMLHSGVHATITGVLLAFAIPFQKGESSSISYQLEHFLHKPVSFIILPIFALANTAIVLHFSEDNFNIPVYALGIVLGLTIGKPLGIALFSLGAVYFKLAVLPDDLNWKHVLGAGLLGGIGFTMSIFITLLAFNDLGIINTAKLYIIMASIIAALLGLLFLTRVLKTENLAE